MPGFLLWDLLSVQPWPFLYFHFSKILKLNYSYLNKHNLQKTTKIRSTFSLHFGRFDFLSLYTGVDYYFSKKAESFTGSFLNFLFLNFIYCVNNFASLLGFSTKSQLDFLF